MSALTFEEFTATNTERCRLWHPGFPDDAWTGADWSNAMQGEAGEAGNIVKKLRRGELSLRGALDPERDVLLAKLKDEIGDTYAYLDLLATYYGIDIAAAITDKFNAVSEREGFDQMIRPA